MRGKFITFEGGEGTGKSTQAAMLALRLEALGHRVQLTREPGGSPGAEVIRHVLLSGAAKPLGPDVEAMLFAAARDDHVQCTILPALEAGKWVICDRFVDSTRVYQGILGAVDHRLIRGLERVAVGDLMPDLTIMLDIPVDVGMARARHADVDRDIEHDGEIGHQVADGHALESADQAMIHCAENALIDARRIHKAIADHPFAGFERRQDRALHMIVARGGKQHGLDIRPERLGRARQQHVANDFGARRTARFAGQLHAMAERFETQRQHGRLGRFPSALAALEGDELPAHANTLSGSRHIVTPSGHSKSRA